VWAWEKGVEGETKGMARSVPVGGGRSSQGGRMKMRGMGRIGLRVNSTSYHHRAPVRVGWQALRRVRQGLLDAEKRAEVAAPYFNDFSAKKLCESSSQKP